MRVLTGSYTVRKLITLNKCICECVGDLLFSLFRFSRDFEELSNYEQVKTKLKSKKLKKAHTRKRKTANLGKRQLQSSQWRS